MYLQKSERGNGDEDDRGGEIVTAEKRAPAVEIGKESETCYEQYSGGDITLRRWRSSGGGRWTDEDRGEEGRCKASAGGDQRWPWLGAAGCGGSACSIAGAAPEFYAEKADFEGSE